MPYRYLSRKSVMQHGDCCCGYAGLAALPSNYYRHFLPQYTPDTSLENPELPTRHTRIMFIRAYLRASTEEQDAGRARASLEQFASDHNKVIASVYLENANGATADRPAGAVAPPERCTQG